MAMNYELVEELRTQFEAHADPSAAAAMSRYMRNQFLFLGIASPLRRSLEQELLAKLRRADEPELTVVARYLWELPEREYQYTALALLGRAAKRLSPASLELCHDLIVLKSWWDTVDALAAQVVGIIVLGHPEEVARMDLWIESPHLWLRRSALIHQLKFKERTDTDRLFHYCLLMASDKDFFIRKAIGWALRQYSWTDPTAVREFVVANGALLSPLSKREALLAINGRRMRSQSQSE